MCGRFYNHIESARRWATILGEDWPAEEDMSFNICPTQQVPLITASGRQKMRWGLVPHWSKVPKTRYSTINARAEKAPQSPAYRGAWARGQRCLIPAGGYYEWRRDGDRKQPYCVTRQDSEPLMFAGLWDHWAGEGAEPFDSFTIITTEPAGKLADLHHRMPLMLRGEQAEAWLRDDPAQCSGMLMPQEPENINFYPVSTRVNSPRNQGVELLARIDA